MKLHFLGLLVFASCASVATGKRAVVNLDGLTLPLISSPGFHLEVSGLANSKPARVTFDVSSPVSFATKACLANRDMKAQLTLADPFGPDESYDLASLGELMLGDRSLTGLLVGVVAGTQCRVILGRDALAKRSMHISAARREVSFTQGFTKPTPANDDTHRVTIPLTFDPKYDWPLLAVQMRQAQTETTLVMLLSTNERRTRLFEVTAREHNLQLGPEMFEKSEAALREEMKKRRTIPYESLALAPGFEVNTGTAEIESGSSPHAIAGVLGLDVLSRFRVTIDLNLGQLILERPKTNGRTCVLNEKESADNCFEIHARKMGAENSVVITSWKPLPTGATFFINGPSDGCRMGVSFSPSDVGISHQLVIPTPKLPDECTQNAISAQMNLLMMLDEPVAQCDGTCSFFQKTHDRRLYCVCQPSLSGLSADAELEMLKALRKKIREELKIEEPPDPD
jgi:hypothetical protein